MTEPTAPNVATAEAEARALLARLTLTGLHSHETRNEVAWSGILRIDGQAVLTVEQAGDGGANHYRAARGRDVVSARKIRGILELAAKVCGLGPTEALDRLTAAMGPGLTGLDGVAASLAHKAEYDIAFGVSS